MTEKYKSAFNVETQRLGIQSCSTYEDIVHMWERFVRQVELGYRSSYDDYLHDVSRRDKLERLVGSSTLAKFPEHREFSGLMEQLDKRLKQTLLQEKVYEGVEWWEAYIPAHASEVFVITLEPRLQPKVKIV